MEGDMKNGKKNSGFTLGMVLADDRLVYSNRWPDHVHHLGIRQQRV